MSVTRVEVPAPPEVIAQWESHFVEQANDEGLTVAELAKIAGVGQTTMRQMVNKGSADGTYIKGAAFRMFDGIRKRVAVYQLVDKKAKKTRKA